MISLPSQRRSFGFILLIAVGARCPSWHVQAAPRNPALQYVQAFDFDALRLAIEDLIETSGARYPRGRELKSRLRALEAQCREGAGAATLAARLKALKREALLANPLLDFGNLLLVKRGVKRLPQYTTKQQVAISVGMPCNHWCNASLPRRGHDNEIAVLSPLRPDGKLTTLYRPAGGHYVGEIDLHFDAARMLFSGTTEDNWRVFEIDVDGRGLRQVSQCPNDVDHFDACYLPSGKIVFGSTASYQAVPCWSGIPHRVANLYVMDADGTDVRQLCYDQDHDLYPTVRNDGQIMFTRWEYTGTRHEYLRVLTVMNPDGTGQRGLYGSNSWWPNALYFARPIPGDPRKVIAVVSDYHGLPRIGELALLDTSKGWYDADGVVQRIPGRGKKVEAVIEEKNVIGKWPLFLHPYPLSDKYFLVACRPTREHTWGIYLVDVFDNLELVHEVPGYALQEPIPLRKRPRPPVVPEVVEPGNRDAVIYVHSVYNGPGLEGVPEGTIKKLRIVAYHFGYPNLAGGNRIGMNGPWEVMRILGTVPVHDDGSALFRLPANTPVTVQPLDAEGKAVQWMRSWFTAMPGEHLSCTGCHEQVADVVPQRTVAAARRQPDAIIPWRGPARGFDFEREVQPVLDRYCVGCHNQKRWVGRRVMHDFRRRELVKDYQGIRYKGEDGRRLERVNTSKPQGQRSILFFTPAYQTLLAYVRRLAAEDDLEMCVPGEYHADTSRLVQMLRSGHHCVKLDEEAWDRLITWIDLNAPCHGTWGEVYPIPKNAHARRMALREACCGPTEDPEAIPEVPTAEPIEPVMPSPPEAGNQQPAVAALPGWPFDAAEAKRRQAAGGPHEKTIDLGNGVAMKLVRIPAGEFLMGDGAARAEVERDFWIGVTEMTNEQYAAFDPTHDSGYARRYRINSTARKSRPLNEPKQPVVRVSWHRAVAFCRWLSERSGMQVSLPTETQWEYACRAGSAAEFHCGDWSKDLAKFANTADKPLGWLGDWHLKDGSIVTAEAGQYLSNAWGLHDMHGNAAEWTRTTCRSQPRTGDPASRMVVRGGSFYDLSVSCRSGARTSYPAWQRLYNIGFRVVAEE